MSNTWKTQSIFVSSTFVDMQSERDALRDQVLPQLEEFARQYRHTIELVDLRWGVDSSGLADEEQSGRKILNVCLEEIDRCQPFIIVLVGDRYGWVPESRLIKQVTYEKGYVLESYEKSVTALEIEYSVFNKPANQKHSYFYFRNRLPLDAEDIQIRTRYIDADITAQNRLKHEIRGMDGANIRDYSAEWDSANKAVAGLSGFCDQVLEDLKKAMFAHWQHDLNDDQTWQNTENEILEGAFYDKNMRFTARKKECEALLDFAFSTERSCKKLLLLKGERGSGKSSLMANLFYSLRQNEKCYVLAWSGGVSANSQNLAAMLAVFIHNLCRHLDIKDDSDLYRNDYDMLIERFYELLRVACIGTRVIILVDALDEMSRTNEKSRFLWVSLDWPENARLIATVTEGEELLAVEKRGGIVQDLQPLVKEDIHEIASSLFQSYHKELSTEALDMILSKLDSKGQVAAGNPLYLSLIVHGLIIMNRQDFEAVYEMQKSGFDGNEAIKRHILHRIEEFPCELGALYIDLLDRAAKEIGEDYTYAIIGIIAASRYGFSENMLAGIMMELGFEWNSPDFANLRRYLHIYLRQREQGKWDFSHAAIRESLIAHFTGIDPSFIRNFNVAITQYLEACHPDDDVRISEYPYHLFVQSDLKRLQQYEFYIFTAPIKGKALMGLVDSFVLAYNIQRKSEGVPPCKWLDSVISYSETTNLYRPITDVFIELLPGMLPAGAPLEDKLHILTSAATVLKQKIVNLRDDFLRLSSAYEQIGDLYIALDRITEAEAHYNGIIRTYSQIITDDTTASRESCENAIFLFELFVCASNYKLGRMYLELGKLDQCYSYARRLLEATQKISFATASAQGKQLIIHTHSLLSDYYRKIGRTTLAQQHLKACDGLLHQLDITENQTKRTENVLILQQAQNHMISGHFEQSLALNLKGLEAARQIYEKTGEEEDGKTLLMSYSNVTADMVRLDRFDDTSILEQYMALAQGFYHEHQTTANLFHIMCALERTGDCFYSKGDYEKARQYYQDLLGYTEKLMQDSSPAQSRYAYAVVLHRLALIEEQQGRISEAIELTCKAVEQAKIHADESKNSEHIEGLVILSDIAAKLYQSIGDHDKAIQCYHSALKYAERLASIEASDNYIERLLSIQTLEGAAHMKAGHNKQAIYSFNASIALAREHGNHPKSSGIIAICQHYIRLCS